MKVLVAVDGSRNSERAVAYAIRDAAGRSGKVELHLVNVQAPVTSSNVRRFVTKAMLENYRREQGERVLSAACRMLDRAKVPYRTHIMAGHVAETIVWQAKKLRCGEIIMGTRGMGAIASALVGSVATKVIHLTKLPVTLVK
jgi:nucleotide-binding universal stress UspA family protein